VDPCRRYWVRPHPDQNTKYAIVCMFLRHSHPLNPNVCTHNSAESTKRGHNNPQLSTHSPISARPPSAWNHRQLGSHFDSHETVDASPPLGDSANSDGWWPTAIGHRPWPIGHGHCCALAKHVALGSRAPRAQHIPPCCPNCDLLYYVHPSKVKVSNF